MTAPHLARRTTKWQRSDKARRSRDDRAENRLLPTWPRKDAVACCLATRDGDGRLCVGFCGPDCQRRPANVEVRNA